MGLAPGLEAVDTGRDPDFGGTRPSLEGTQYSQPDTLPGNAAGDLESANLGTCEGQGLFRCAMSRTTTFEAASDGPDSSRGRGQSYTQGRGHTVHRKLPEVR